MALAGIRKQKHEKVQQNANASEVEDSGAGSDGSGEETTHTEGNAGWADSIAKVLNTSKPKTKKTIVLSRAKKNKVGEQKKTAKRPEDYGFEIADADGIKTEQVDELQPEVKPDKKQLDVQVKRRKNMPLELRMRPSWRDIERERTLRKVATRGVVQLFNAVRIQQKDLQQQLEDAGPLDSRKDAVLKNIDKRKFLDVLMSGSRAKSEAVDNTVKNELKRESSSDEEDDDSDEDAAEQGTTSSSSRRRKSEWNVLRNDFMTNKKIKHWDEENEDDIDGSAQANNSDSDDD